MKIEEASSDEIWIIQSLAERVWAKTYRDLISKEQIEYMMEMMYSASSLKKQMTEEKHHFLLVKDDFEYIAYLSYELNSDNSEYTKIHKIYVLSTMQGKGIGERLIKEVIKTAKENHNIGLKLNVNRGNKAIGFYERLGFKQTEIQNIDIGNGYLMEDYVMTKII